jgi:hypothetical protein
MAVDAGDQLFLGKRPQHAVDMHSRQARGIANLLLGHRQWQIIADIGLQHS